MPSGARGWPRRWWDAGRRSGASAWPALHHLGHAGDGVAAVAEADHRLQRSGWSISPGWASTASNQRVVGMPFFSMSSWRRSGPGGTRRRPSPGEVPPRPLGQAVVGGQGDTSRPMSVAPARCSGRDRCCPAAGHADVAQRQLQDAEGAHVGRADALLRGPMHQISVLGRFLAMASATR